MPNVFGVPIFFIIFRETLETSIVVSVLLAFLKQQLGPDQDRNLYKKLRKQVFSSNGLPTTSPTYSPTYLLSFRYGSAPSSA
jgi:high-affinity iron transporter